MAVTLEKFAASDYRRYTDPLQVSGGGEGYDGMTQLVFRLSRGPATSMSEDQYNLPQGTDFQVQKLDGLSEGLIFLWSRTIRPDSPKVTIESATTPTTARMDKKIEIIVSPAQTVGYHWTKIEGSSADIVTLPQGLTMLNIRAGAISSSYQGFIDLGGFTTIDKVSSGQYNQGMLHHVSWIQAGRRDIQVNVGSNEIYGYIDVFANIYLILHEGSPISFQIMHNGQLIPATPNLWSGGQLTPVALNLPE